MNPCTTFFLNGQKYTLHKNITLFQLITYFNYNNDIFVIEHNNIICNQKNWTNINIKKKDKIEIITIVGGG